MLLRHLATMDKGDILSTLRSDIRRTPRRGGARELSHSRRARGRSNAINNLSANPIAAQTVASLGTGGQDLSNRDRRWNEGRGKIARQQSLRHGVCTEGVRR